MVVVAAVVALKTTKRKAHKLVKQHLQLLLLQITTMNTKV